MEVKDRVWQQSLAGFDIPADSEGLPPATLDVVALENAVFGIGSDWRAALDNWPIKLAKAS